MWQEKKEDRKYNKKCDDHVNAVVLDTFFAIFDTVYFFSLVTMWTQIKCQIVDPTRVWATPESTTVIKQRQAVDF